MKAAIEEMRVEELIRSRKTHNKEMQALDDQLENKKKGKQRTSYLLELDDILEDVCHGKDWSDGEGVAVTEGSG